MDEAPVTTLSNVLIESPEVSPTVCSMPDDIRSQQKPSADILAMPERLNEVPEWLRTPLRRFLRLKERNWPARDCPTLDQTAFQSVEPHDNLFHPAL